MTHKINIKIKVAVKTLCFSFVYLSATILIIVPRLKDVKLLPCGDWLFKKSFENACFATKNPPDVPIGHATHICPPLSISATSKSLRCTP